MASADLVVDLQDLGSADLPRVGGKAANLGELMRAGFPVPAGFAVTTEAYGLAAGSTTDRDTIRAAPVPEAVAAAVRSAYAALGAEVPVAVRSSATAEDLPTASFAGQQDTFLHVVGADAVLGAVRDCWASLWTDRAISYRDAAGTDHATVRLAVIVQRMVDSAVAGVLFTADPLTGTRTSTVLDASPGLGEAVVSGAVNPDHVRVDAADVIDYRPGTRTVAIRGRAGGGTERVELTGTGRALDDPQVHALVAAGRAVEKHFGAPQDIEWAFDEDGMLWLTQSRPITTLHPVPAPARPGRRAFMCASLAQGLTRPITPMGLAAFRLIAAAGGRLAFGSQPAEPLDGPQPYADAGGRLFADVTGALRSEIGRVLVPRLLDVMEARTAVVLRSLLDDPAFAPEPGSRIEFLRTIGRPVVKFRMPLILARSLARPAWGQAHMAMIRDRVDELVARPCGSSGAERLDHATGLLRKVFSMMPRAIPVLVAGLGSLVTAGQIAGDAIDEATLHEITRSLPHNPTTQMDLALWAMATRLREDPASTQAIRDRGGELPPVLRAELAAFLSRYGHRAVAEIDIGMPRWSEDPTHLLGVLANYLQLDDPALAPDVQFARGERAAEAAIERAVAAVRSQSRTRAALVRFLLGRARELAGLREVPKDCLVRLIARARELIGEVGGELAGRGLLDRADDVFFLDLREARSALGGADHRALVTARREEYDRELRRRHIPRVLLSDGTEPETLLASTAVEGALVGTAASAGTVTAKARVILDPVGARLEPGEILVAPSTDPGWTPLFLTAGGLVMEMGGANSHGAVVAREYGIPAVVGVPDATSLIETGDQVTVDGAAGRVTHERT